MKDVLNLIQSMSQKNNLRVGAILSKVLDDSIDLRYIDDEDLLGRILAIPESKLQRTGGAIRSKELYDVYIGKVLVGDDAGFSTKDFEDVKAMVRAKGNISLIAFDAWIAPMKLFAVNGDCLIVVIKGDKNLATYIVRRFVPYLEEQIVEGYGYKYKISVANWS